MSRIGFWVCVLALLSVFAPLHCAPIYSENFEGATQTVDWDLNTGDSWLDLNVPFQATLPADWIYGNDGWGLTSGWDVISLQPYAYEGRSFHSWAIYDSHKAASPTIFLTPGKYRFRFWLRMGSLRPQDGNPGGATWVEWGILKKENGLDDNQPGAPGWSKPPIPQGNRLDWTLFDVTFDIVSAGEYRVGFKVGSVTPLGVFANVDNLVLERAGFSVSGKVILGDYGGSPSAVPVEAIVRLAGSTDPLRTETLTLDDEGNFTIAGLDPGTYDVAFKASHWLRTVLRGISIVESDVVIMIPIVLTNGDIDGDNEVTLFDFGQLVAAFGSMPGDSNWNPDADLDGDGEVTLFDFGILVKNFGAMGEE